MQHLASCAKRPVSRPSSERKKTKEKKGGYSDSDDEDTSHQVPKSSNGDLPLRSKFVFWAADKQTTG